VSVCIPSAGSPGRQYAAYDSGGRVVNPVPPPPPPPRNQDRVNNRDGGGGGEGGGGGWRLE